ncbi:Citrate lyase beta chain [Granulibacter bethesdensis]|uniref:Citrate lyase beta chain n=1 Tax=Granulibacter bethesdensis TaxID=364410 RepID=A0AAC9KCZ6_9PROT|nr:itaconate degradation C-C-lyase RipC [Granulibacter bethesdensis]APH55093.1 Citrate lyase beta chain [Granulibacter bethesdensis]APH62679.1 Citrate lyase beta chain [Granulibacter bethesdensis]
MPPTRSWLFTPATRPERFTKAIEAGADVLILDLEDAVAPKDKTSARRAAFDALERARGGCARALRVNGLDTADGLTDVLALLESEVAPDFLILPKTESADHLLILDRLLARTGRDIRLVGLIESARGLAAVERIAKATPRLHGLMLGVADMAADLGSTSDWSALAHVRGRLIAACALGGIAAIDSPFFDIRDAAGMEREVRAAVALGFAAKAAIHPNQISLINTSLTPSEADVAEARDILAANEKGVGVVNGRMIDEAMARKARRVLAAVSSRDLSLSKENHNG